MKNHFLLKIISFFLVAVLVANLVLFATGKLTPIALWLIIIIIGLVAYKVIPSLKK